MIFDITPVSKPRMTQRDKRPPVRPEVARYRAFADEIRLRANLAGFSLPAAFDVIFYIPMPASWSMAKKRRMAGQPHQQRPDRDNLEKALGDALLPDGDAHIYDGRVAKYWGSQGAIHIIPINPAPLIAAAYTVALLGASVAELECRVPV